MGMPRICGSDRQRSPFADNLARMGRAGFRNRRLSGVYWVVDGSFVGRGRTALMRRGGQVGTLRVGRVDPICVMRVMQGAISAILERASAQPLPSHGHALAWEQ
jgi:hypothetical protein